MRNKTIIKRLDQGPDFGKTLPKTATLSKHGLQFRGSRAAASGATRTASDSPALQTAFTSGVQVNPPLGNPKVHPNQNREKTKPRHYVV